MDTIITAVIAWLVTTMGLPAPHESPRVELVSAAQMQAVLARGRAASHGPGAATAAADSHAHEGTFEIEAAYEDTTRTIYLSDAWTGATPAEMSVLVHEMVHHLQNLAGMKYECPQARECEAYVAQDRWLEQSGRNLLDEFQLDPMTFLLRTRCVG